MNDPHLLRRSVMLSVGIHLTLTLSLSIVIQTSAKPFPTAAGYVVELVELPESPRDVPAVREGAEDASGEIRLPSDRRKPESKPAPRRVKERIRQTPAKPATKAAPPPAAPPPEMLPGAGGRLETEEPFPFDYYTEAITRLIFSRWVPLAGTPDGSTVVVHFFIGRDGSVSRLEIVEGSGYAVFDRGGLAAVRDVGRFPTLPEGFKGSRLGVKFHFEYRQVAR